MIRRILAATVACAASLPLAPEVRAFEEPSKTDEAVQVLVLREGGAGSAATAQRYIDEVMKSVARVNEWSKVTGTYQTRREAAQTFIEEQKPSFGILSLGPFLAMRQSEKLEVLGTAKIRGGEGEHYYVVSKSAASLEECKGEKLATDHGGDERFIDAIVSGDDFDLSDFEVEKTRRPLQTLKAVIRDEATCALIDDAQMADLPHVDGGEALRPVWFSKALPAMIVVAFPAAPKDRVKSFEKNLSKICEGEGRSACDAAGILELKAGKSASLQPLIKAYEK